MQNSKTQLNKNYSLIKIFNFRAAIEKLENIFETFRSRLIYDSYQSTIGQN